VRVIGDNRVPFFHFILSCRTKCIYMRHVQLCCYRNTLMLRYKLIREIRDLDGCYSNCKKYAGEAK
jgi:hypothetical protein